MPEGMVPAKHADELAAFHERRKAMLAEFRGLSDAIFEFCMAHGYREQASAALVCSSHRTLRSILIQVEQKVGYVATDESASS